MVHAADRAINFYRSLMEEVKIRTSFVEQILESPEADPYRWIGGEIAYLQLRLICESIALCCLAVHDELELTNGGKLQKEYSAEQIFRRLERLNPYFYPIPIVQVDIPGETRKIEKSNAPYLDRERLVSLYSTCGQFLHRGTMKSLIRPKVIDFGLVRDSVNRIKALLSAHSISSPAADKLFVTLMQAETGAVQTFFMEITNK